MKRLLLLILALALSPRGYADTAMDLLSKKLNAFTTMTANFEQSLVTEQDPNAQRLVGTMALSRPGKFIWKTTYPNQQTLIANGNYAWIYDEDLEQATKQKINTSSANSPAIFLTGNVTDVPKRFVVAQDDDVFTLTAKNKNDMFQKFTLTFRVNALHNMTVTTKLDQQSRFVFSNIKLNPTFPKNYFTFSPPKGVEIIEN
ncbi:MAG: outer membrane lipoprotein chaperone LolA [Coxiellaceae bacterium]|nr:outer membrane lipoprotein chaperone LolA [Coxiellaceae bacterium]